VELGKCYEQTGMTEKALSSWETASLMIPSRFTPDYLSMKLLFKQKKYPEAVKYARILNTKKRKTENPEVDRMLTDVKHILEYCTN
jgi:hypothetical protein